MVDCLAATGQAHGLSCGETLVDGQVVAGFHRGVAAGVGRAGQLGALRVDPQVAGRNRLRQGHLAVGVDADIAGAGPHVAGQPHSDPGLGAQQTDGSGVHAAQGGAVDGQGRRGAAIGGARGGGQALGLHVVAAGDDVQVAGMEFGVDPSAAGNQLELVDIAGIQAVTFDGDVTAIHLEAAEPPAFQHRLAGGHGHPRGVDEAAAVAGEAMGVGHYDPRRLAGDFGIAGQQAAVAAGDFVEDGAGGATLEVGVAEDQAAKLGGLGPLRGVVEDQPLRADVVFAEAVVGQAVAIGRGDVDHRHAVTGLAQPGIAGGGLVHRQLRGGSDDRIEEEDADQDQGEILEEGAAGIHAAGLLSWPTQKKRSKRK
ncbi:hypothetical protein FQZ97_641540 [compost metagenome]